MSTNLQAVKRMYDAFAEGDIPTVLDQMSPDIVWHEAENFPYADRSPYKGPEAVLEGVFARCGSEWDGFGVEIEELIDAGETIVGLGRYSGTYKATGKAQNPQLAHIWRVKDGKVVGFQQHVDTLHVAEVTGTR